MQLSQERINYVIENGVYCGSFTNHPIVIQADSLEDLKRRAKAIFEAYLTDLTKMFNQNEPFEYNESINE